MKVADVSERRTDFTMEQVLEIALESGTRIMRFYQQACTVRVDGRAGPVTDADLSAHEHILSELERMDPGTPVISEESSFPEYGERCQWPRFWLVDPLDGTKEFLAANGEFTVNIALVENGEPVVGVIVAPALETVYFAQRGAGSWKRERGGRSVRLVGTADCGSVTRVAESRSHPSARLEAFIASLGPVVRTRVGSSLKFCRVAEGTSDLYPRFGRTMEWDVAAGDCIYRNSTPDGTQRPSPLRYNQPSLSTASFVIGQARSGR